jgi:hypothetical protein
MMQNDLLTMLDDTHAALLQGDLAAIGPASVRMEGLIDQLRTCPADTLALIRTKAARNAAVLQAAAQGVRAAHRRLSDLQEAASGHRTYGRDGHRSTMTGPAAILRQRI